MTLIQSFVYASSAFSLDAETYSRTESISDSGMTRSSTHHLFLLELYQVRLDLHTDIIGN